MWQSVVVDTRWVGPAVVGLVASACALDHIPVDDIPPPPKAGAETCAADARSATQLELPRWDLHLGLDAWDALHKDVQAKVAVGATLCIEGKRHPINLELQGASSRQERKKSFDLKFKRGVLLDSPFVDGDDRAATRAPMDRVMLKAMYRDQSLIREALAFDLWRALGRIAPRTAFANLHINGAPWGLYVIVEPIDADFLARHGYPPDGRLYQAVRRDGERADFAPGRDLEVAFEYKFEERTGAYEDLELLANTLQKTALNAEDYETAIDPIFPLEQYFDRLAWVSFTQNGDATTQNFYLYNTPQQGQDHWHLLPWDSNSCFGSDWRDPYAVRDPAASPMIDGRNYLGRRLVRVDGLRQRYVARFRQVMDEVLTEERVMARCQHYVDQVAHDLALDQRRWRRPIDPEQASDALFDFLAERPAVLHEGLTQLQRDHGDPPQEADAQQTAEQITEQHRVADGGAPDGGQPDGSQPDGSQPDR